MTRTTVFLPTKAEVGVKPWAPPALGETESHASGVWCQVISVRGLDTAQTPKVLGRHLKRHIWPFPPLSDGGKECHPENIPAWEALCSLNAWELEKVSLLICRILFKMTGKSPLRGASVWRSPCQDPGLEGDSGWWKARGWRGSSSQSPHGWADSMLRATGLRQELSWQPVFTQQQQVSSQAGHWVNQAPVPAERWQPAGAAELGRCLSAGAVDRGAVTDSELSWEAVSRARPRPRVQVTRSSRQAAQPLPSRDLRSVRSSASGHVNSRAAIK